MKRSTRYILILLAAIAVCMIVMTAVVRGIVHDELVINRNNSEELFLAKDNGKRVERSYNLDGFDSVQIEGTWNMLIIRDDEFSVTADFKEAYENIYEVRKSGDTLVLDMKIHNVGDAKANITIRMPSLTLIDLDGAANIDFEGFNEEELFLDIAGAGSIKGEDSRFEKLKIVSEGAVNIEMDNCPARNAVVHIDGAGNVLLNMDGGSLTGSLNGMGNIEYTGTVSRLDVDKNGLGWIKQSE